VNHACGCLKRRSPLGTFLSDITLENKTVNYGKNCQATFERKSSTKPVGMVGPADTTWQSSFVNNEKWRFEPLS
jgi:hypothetical protein